MNLRASSAYRYAVCPGSYTAELNLAETTSPFAERGKRIHALIEKMDENAAKDEVETAKLLIEQRNKAITDECLMSVNEQQLYLKGTPWSGRPDTVLFTNDAIHLVDYKSGWGNVPEADCNAQLRCYVVMVDQEYNSVKKRPIIGHIIQQHGFSSVVYNAQDIINAKMELVEIASHVANKPDVRIPTPDGCLYCKAFGSPARCKESCAVATMTGQELLTTTTEEELRLIPADKLAKALDALALCEKLNKMYRNEAKIRLENDPNSIDGYSLKKGSERTSCTNVEKLFYLVPDSVFFAAVESLSLSSIVDAYSSKVGVSKKEALDTVKKLMEGFLETTKTDPSLKRK
jgi:hypothetical protein